MITQYTPYFPEYYNQYFEPFIGGGAVFFHLNPLNAHISDVNEELFQTYRVVRDKVESLIKDLGRYVNTEEYFYQVRLQKPSDLSDIEVASRFIFLNHTCFNGLYRVNRRGQFNAPFGFYKNPMIQNELGLRGASKALQGVDIQCCDFEEALVGAKHNDFVYLDPPYIPLTPTSNFTSYSSGGFNIGDQERLAKLVGKLGLRGCKIMLSNSDTPLTRKLYEGFKIVSVKARRAINSDSTKRGPVSEVLVLNY